MTCWCRQNFQILNHQQNQWIKKHSLVLGDSLTLVTFVGTRDGDCQWYSSHAITLAVKNLLTNTWYICQLDLTTWLGCGDSTQFQRMAHPKWNTENNAIPKLTRQFFISGFLVPNLLTEISLASAKWDHISSKKLAEYWAECPSWQFLPEECKKGLLLWS